MERWCSMGMSAGNSYAQNYADTLAEAAGWSNEMLTVALGAMMSHTDKTDDTWGAIDALTDLLGEIERPT
jgi:hypothetical protein